jgi:hypothetical protein
MSRFGLRTCVLLVCLMCFLTLVLPFCVPSAESRVLLPSGRGGVPPPPTPGSDDADPDDIAVNSARGTGGGLGGGFGFGSETCVVIAGAWVGTEKCMPLEEVPVASTGRDSARWLLLVWVLASQLVTSF